MKVTIKDGSILKTLKPLEVVAYLRASGWREETKEEGEFSVWIKDGDFEVVLPLDQSYADFALRMSDILQVLEVVEGRPQNEILADLLIFNVDIIRLRLKNADLTPGSIPIEQHTVIAQKTRDLMLAAACATLEVRPVWYKKKPDQVFDYLKKVRIGQTEVGSYVFTILSPVPPQLSESDTSLFEMEVPFERKVTLKLADALTASKTAAEIAVTTGSMNPFRESLDKGITANLCEAIEGLSGEKGETRSVEFGFSWSRNRPLSEEDTRPPSVVFQADTIPVIAEAGRILKGTAPQEDFELRGPVVGLRREQEAETGRVTVAANIDAELRRVTLELGDPEYVIACQAHELLDEADLICYGSLNKKGPSYTLTLPRGVKMEKARDGDSE